MTKILISYFIQAASLYRIKRSSLFQHGHHRWRTDEFATFDVKQEKLATI